MFATATSRGRRNPSWKLRHRSKLRILPRDREMPREGLCGKSLKPVLRQLPHGQLAVPGGKQLRAVFVERRRMDVHRRLVGAKNFLGRRIVKLDQSAVVATDAGKPRPI